MSKQTKRKITVEVSSKNEQPKTRPSVFERLGTKASSSSTSVQDYCRHWSQNGTCPYGKNCKYANTHTLISPSKVRAAKKDDNKNKRPISKDDGKRLHSTIVKASRSPEPEWEQWDQTDLEDADAEVLEKRRQELQRELELQMKMESKLSKKKDKKIKKGSSSSSSGSSSSSSDSSSSSEESSSTSSSTSIDSRRKKNKRNTSKRDSSSSSEPERRKKKPPVKPTVHKHPPLTKPQSGTNDSNRTKKPASPPPPIHKANVTKPIKSPTRHLSQTPPPKNKVTVPPKPNPNLKPASTTERKEKHRTPSPKPKDRDKSRDKSREKDRERDREREKRDKPREKPKNTREPPPRNARETKNKNSPESNNSRDRKPSPSRSRSNGTTRRNDSKSSPTLKDDRRADKSREDDRKRERDRRDPKDRSLERRRERERDRRITREKEREKEREEALARCQERQRERERLKELAKKEREIPSLLHITTNSRRDRERSRDRGLEKPPSDRVERLLPLPADRIPAVRKEITRSQERNSRPTNDRDRSRNNRTSDRSRERGDHNLDRERNLERGFEHRNYDRPPGDQRFDRDHDRDRNERDFSMGRNRDERRHDDKSYDSPYDNRSSRRDDPRYLELDHEHYSEPAREDRRLPLDYEDRRRWENDPEMELDNDRRRGYVREDSRPPPSVKSRDWDPDYISRDWERGSRRPHDWEGHRDDWDPAEHASIEDDWRHYNRSMDSWPDDRRRWPEFPERTRPGPKSTSSHRDDDDQRRHETKSVEHQEIIHEEPKKESLLGKRPSETPEEVPEPKKLCLEETPALEDDLSEISDDADEILNREDEPAEVLMETQTEDEKPTVNQLSHEQEIEGDQKTQSSPVPGSHESALDEDGIDHMDFEEISDEELEEEIKVKGLGDALGVDWASLVAESRPRIKQEKSDSAKKRWESCKVLTRLGLSVTMAGENLVKEILLENQQKEKEEEKKSDAEESKEAIANVKIPHPIAAIQVAIREKQMIRTNLFATAGPYRRALSARRDLSIRRHLCNLPIRDVFIEQPRTTENNELFRQALELVERSL